MEELTQGNLTTIYNEEVKEYATGHVVFGYMGHYLRSLNTDNELQAFVNKNPKYLPTAQEWVCSRCARHFMDSFEEDENTDDFANCIEEELEYFKKTRRKR